VSVIGAYGQALQALQAEEAARCVVEAGDGGEPSGLPGAYGYARSVPLHQVVYAGEVIDAAVQGLRLGVVTVPAARTLVIGATSLHPHAAPLADQAGVDAVQGQDDLRAWPRASHSNSGRAGFILFVASGALPHATVHIPTAWSRSIILVELLCSLLLFLLGASGRCYHDEGQRAEQGAQEAGRGE